MNHSRLIDLGIFTGVVGWITCFIETLGKYVTLKDRLFVQFIVIKTGQKQPYIPLYKSVSVKSPHIFSNSR